MPIRVKSPISVRAPLHANGYTKVTVVTVSGSVTLTAALEPPPPPEPDESADNLNI